jgi:hypothetical protein
MLNNNYNKNSLEAVTQGSRVSGHPNRVSFYSVKTTLLLLLVLANISLADEVENKFSNFVDSFNEVSPIKLKPQKFESATEAEIRILKEADEARDVALNKAEVREHRYWIDGRWVCVDTNQPEKKVYVPAQKESEIVDSDNDGYDDYTEHKHGTDPEDARKTPAIRKGNNPVTFKMDGCKGGGFQFDMFKGSYKGVGIGGVSIPKEKLKELMNTSSQ